jgi:hypothetical protein
MKRIFKFRGYSSVLSKWIYGSLLQNEEGEAFIIPFENVELDGHHIKITGDEPVLVEQESIGRSAFDIKNKNGNELYEGDKIQVKEGVDCFCNYTVSINETLDWYPLLDFEIMGNLFENK